MAGIIMGFALLFLCVGFILIGYRLCYVIITTEDVKAKKALPRFLLFLAAAFVGLLALAEGLTAIINPFIIR